MQFSSKSAQKSVNSVKKNNKPDWTILELLSQALNFKDAKISLYIIVLIVCGCFDRMHNVTSRVLINYFCTWYARFAPV